MCTYMSLFIQKVICFYDNLLDLQCVINPLVFCCFPKLCLNVVHSWHFNIGDRFPTDFMLCSTISYQGESNWLRNAIQIYLHMFYVKSLTAYLVNIRSMLIVVTFGVCVSWLTWFGQHIRRVRQKLAAAHVQSFQSTCRETHQNLFVWLIICCYVRKSNT